MDFFFQPDSANWMNCNNGACTNDALFLVFFCLICPSDPPDRPTNISCVNQVFSHERSAVTCTWGRGRDTKLWDSAVLQWVWKGTLRNRHGKHLAYWIFILTLMPLSSIILCVCVCCSVRSLPGNYTVAAGSKGGGFRSASVNVSTSVHMIAVWIQTHNALGSKVSAHVNYALSDIGKTSGT